jgi:hypothetical protein
MFVLVFLLSISSALPFEEKLDPEELVSLHLASVGSKEAISSYKTNVIDGTAQLKFIQLGSGTIGGTSLFFSQDQMFRLTLQFQHPEYGGEDVVFDGKDFLVGHSTPEARSPLGQFLFTYNSVVKEGLLGSVLSTAWPLFDLKEKRPELRYEGLKELDDEKLHCLRYEMREGGRDVRIRTYFSPENGRHVRTIYDVDISAFMDSSATRVNTTKLRYKLEEIFTDFSTIDGLTLPKTWTIRYSTSGKLNLLWEWTISCEKVAVNSSLQ